MNRIELQPLPQTAWCMREVIDEEGTLGPEKSITDIVYSTDPDLTLRRILAANNVQLP